MIFVVGPNLTQTFFLDLQRSKGGRENWFGVFCTTSGIPTVAEARANGAGAMVGEFVCNVIVETKGGAIGVGVEPCQEGGTFVAEFKIASINCWAGFGVFAAARGATGRPWSRRADWEQERD